MELPKTIEKDEAWLKKWGVLVILSLAMFILVIDMTMMNVSLSALVNDLNTSVTNVQAAITIYSLVMAAFMITGGKLGYIYGTKKIFLIGTAMFGVGTTIATLAPTIGVLTLGWSIIEGVGAALMLPICASLIMTTYSGRDRAIGFGAFGAISAGGAVLGPIIGGFFTTYLSWRCAFGMEIIIVLIILSFHGVLKGSPGKSKYKFDVPSSVLTVIGLTFMVLGLLLAGTFGWWAALNPVIILGRQLALFGLSPTPILLAAGALVMGFFVWRQFWLERAGREPLVAISIFKSMGCMLSTTINGLQALSLAGMMFILPFFFQQVLDYNAMQTGIIILPMSIAVMGLALTSAPLGARIPKKYIIQVGIIVSAVGMFLIRGEFGIGMDMLRVLPGFAVFGAGTGIMLAQMDNLTLSSVPQNKSSEASGLNSTIEKFGSSLGTAIIGSILIFGFVGLMLSGVQASGDFSPDMETEIADFASQYTLTMGDVDALADAKQSFGDFDQQHMDEAIRIAESSIEKAMRFAFDAILVSLGISLLLSLGLPSVRKLHH